MTLVQIRSFEKLLREKKIFLSPQTEKKIPQRWGTFNFFPFRKLLLPSKYFGNFLNDEGFF